METTDHRRSMDWITVLGVLILLAGLGYTGIGVQEWFVNRHATSGWVAGMVFASGAGICMTGLLTIALSEFVAFVAGPRQKPGWVLRNASKALFMLAGLRVLSTAFFVLYLNELQAALSWTQKFAQPLQNFAQPLTVTAAGAAGTIILITLGFAVARVLPVIEESKTVI